MTSRKVEATVIALHHTPASAQRALPEFKKIVEAGKAIPGRTLWVENGHCELRGAIRGWEKLVRAAYDNGMKIASLESRHALKLKEKIDEYQTAHSYLSSGTPHAADKEFEESLEKAAARVRLTPKQLLLTASVYSMGPLRERKFVANSRKAKKGDLMLINPNHAYRIAPALGLKHEEIIWLDKHSPRRIREYESNLDPKILQKIREWRDELREERRKQSERKKPVE